MNPLSSRFKGKRLDLLAVFTVGVMLVCIATIQYLNSTFLYRDDAVLVGAPLFGADIVWPKNFLLYWMIYALSAFSNLLVVKSFASVSISVILCAFYFIVSRLSGMRWTAAALAVIFVFYPVSVDQSFFISGGHPTAATALFFIYLVSLLAQFERGFKAGAGFNFGVAMLQAIVLYAAGLTSPTYNLAPFLLVLSTTTYLVLEKAARDRRRMRIGLGLLLIAILPAAFQIGNLNNFHYANEPGWVSYSPSGMISNLWIALRTIVADPFQGRPVFAALYIAVLLALAAIIGFALARPQRDGSGTDFTDRLRIAISMGGVLLVSSAITFGPSSIVTHFATRYTIPAYMSGALLIAIFLSIGIAKLRSRRRLVGPVSNGLLLAAALVVAAHYVVATRDMLKPFLASHNRIEQALRGRTWKPDDQVLILLPEDAAESALGFNHWSTWQIRVITGQRNIIGLIGRESRLADLQRNGLFVDKYRDHGSEYWKVVNGRATRLKMVGLERNRALYAFKPGSDGRLVPTTVTIWDGDSARVIRPGGRFATSSQTVGLNRLCEIGGDGSGLFIGLRPTMPSTEKFETIAEGSFTFDGRQERTLSVNVNGENLAYILIRLSAQGERAVRSQKFSDTFPPMPLLAPDLALYDLPDQYRLMGRNSSLEASEPDSDNKALKLALFGCQGKTGFVFLNDAYAGALQKAQFNGVWLFGKGYKNRYWRGEIDEFRVGVLKAEKDAE